MHIEALKAVAPDDPNASVGLLIAGQWCDAGRRDEWRFADELGIVLVLTARGSMLIDVAGVSAVSVVAPVGSPVGQEVS